MYSQIISMYHTQIDDEERGGICIMTNKNPMSIEQKLAVMSKEDMVMMIYLLAKIVESCTYNATHEDILNACFEEMYSDS